MTDTSHSTRRAFLSRSTAAVTGLASAATAAGKLPGAAARSARSNTRVLGANDRINLGVIGIGSIGTAHLRTLMPQAEETNDLQVVAASDLYTKRKELARSIAQLTEQQIHHDYREMLARPDVDAVLIATPDHWHGQMALDAIAAGKDVYLQKPMTYTIEEARKIAEAAKASGRIVQVGVQGTSDPRFRIAKEIILAGEIGEPVAAQGNASRNSINGEWNWRVEPEGTPETIDWKRWLGTAPKRRFSAERFFRWRKYWDYSGGIATDLFYHSLSPLMQTLGPQFPTRVTAAGGIYVQKDREVPDTYMTLIEYPSFTIDLAGCMANSSMGRLHSEVIYGYKGTITFRRGQVVLTPESVFLNPQERSAGTPPVKTFDVPPRKQYAVDIGNCRAHTENFFECMRSRKQPNLDAETGYMVMVAIRLGVDAYRQGAAKLFDPGTQKVIGKPPARPQWEGGGTNPEARS